MTRISSSPLPVPGAGRAGRATDRAPAASGGAPFRAALRAAGKDRAAKLASTDDVYVIASQSPMSADEPAREASIGGGSIGGGSIADIIATSVDDPIGAPPSGALGDSRARPDTGRAARVRRSQERAQGPGEVLLDTMLANAGIAPATVPGPPQPPPPAVVDDSPVATWVAASVARAIGSLRGTAGTSTSASAAAAPVAAGPAAVAPAATAATAELAMPAATPLEQAVHDLIGRVTERDRGRAPRLEADAPRDAEAAPLPVLAAPTFAAAPATAAHEVRAAASAPALAMREAAVPEPPANPSHVHLVLDDGPERTVVTVAVRGSEVHVALRAHDDATAAALARNAASLDHAMRARGLALGEMTTDREPRDQRPPRDPEPRERPARDAERGRFTLEETP